MAFAKWSRPVQDAAGNIIPDVYCEVRRAVQGTPLAVLYADRAGTVSIANPFLAADGVPEFFAIGGAYNVRVYATGYDETFEYQAVGTGAEVDANELLQPGYLLEFEIQTTAPPAAGALRANNVDFAAATRLFVSKVNRAGSSIASRLAAMAPGGKSNKNVLAVTSADGLQVSWAVDAVSDHTDYVELTVSGHSGEAALNAGAISLQSMVSGTDGFVAGLTLVFDGTTTAADPGAGTFRLNHATHPSATAAYIDNLEALAGANIAAVLDSYDDAAAAVRGQLQITSKVNPAIFLLYNVTGTVVDSTGYRTVSLAYVSGNGTLSTATPCALFFSRSGIDGTNGKLSGVEVIKTSGYTAGASDVGKTIILDKATPDTLSFDASATLGINWMVAVKNIGVGTWTLDPNGAETIDSLASIALATGESALICSNGTLLRSLFKAAPGGVTSASGAQQLARNGSFAVNHRVTMPTTDNGFCVDGWRLLLEAANAATITQDTADVPSGAAFALKLTVGSGNNNKFGICSSIESRDVKPLRGGVVSLRVPLKATAGLTDGAGKIRIGIAEYTGTADTSSGDPISSWGAEGTNPTLNTGWAFINTPAAIAVTTSWADYLVENVSVGASANNLTLIIWSDDKTNTQTTDILRIGGYLTLAKGATAPEAVVLPHSMERLRAARHVFSTFKEGDAPADAIGYRTSQLGMRQTGGNLTFTFIWPHGEMGGTPTVTPYNPQVSNANKGYDFNATASVAVTINSVSSKGAEIVITGSDQNLVGTHVTAIWEC